MVYTDEMEKQVAEGTSYLHCFRGTDLRRTEIVCLTWIAQTMSGTALGGLSSYFFEKAGISADNAFKLSWGCSRYKRGGEHIPGLQLGSGFVADLTRLHSQGHDCCVVCARQGWKKDAFPERHVGHVLSFSCKF